MAEIDPKAALRIAARARRRAVADPPAAAVRAAAVLDGALTEWPRTAAVYLAHGSEMDALPVADVLARRGARLCLPAVEAAGLPLVFQEWAPGDAMSVDALGLAAPVEEAEAVTPELVVAPLLAFDRAGRRLGQGGGYYDRTLEALRRDGRVMVVGLAFAEQEVDSLTSEAHDQRLDAVLTDREWIVIVPEEA